MPDNNDKNDAIVSINLEKKSFINLSDDDMKMMDMDNKPHIISPGSIITYYELDNKENISTVMVESIIRKPGDPYYTLFLKNNVIICTNLKIMVKINNSYYHHINHFDFIYSFY